jgi:hypothetical protein
MRKTFQPAAAALTLLAGIAGQGWPVQADDMGGDVA